MSDESGAAPGGERFGAGEGPQTLAQLQGTGAEVVGSDGKKVGELKEVGDADFLIKRTLKSDLRIAVNRVREVVAEDAAHKVVLDLPSDEAKDLGRSGSSEGGDPAANFSETTERGQGS